MQISSFFQYYYLKKYPQDTLSPSLEKAINAIIKRHISELEIRTIAIADSKIDSADCFLKLKQKADKSDIQYLKGRIFALCSEIQKLQKEKDDIAGFVAENSKKQSEDAEEIKLKINGLSLGIDKLNEEQKCFQSEPKKVNSSSEYKNVLVQLGKLTERTENQHSKLEKLDNAQKNSQIIVFHNIKINKQLMNLVEKAETQKNFLDTLENKIEKTLEICNQYKEDIQRFQDQFNSHLNMITAQKVQIIKAFENNDSLTSKIENITSKLEGLNVKETMLSKEYANFLQQIKQNIKEEQDKKIPNSFMQDSKTQLESIKRENIMLRNEFEELRTAIEIDFNRLRTENELLSKEYDRTYQHSRQAETSISKLQNDYKSLFETAQKKEAFYKSHISVEDIHSQNVKKGHKSVIPIPPPDASKKKTTRGRNYKTASFFSVTPESRTSMNKTFADKQMNQSVISQTTNTGRCTRTGYCKKRENMALNRFKLWME